MNLQSALDEQLFHDAQAQSRAHYFAEDPSRYLFEDAAFLNHESWILPAFSQLGEVAGKDALDYGCGHGMAGIVLARRGAKVKAFDLSPGYLEEAQRRAKANGVEIEYRQANAEQLPYAETSVDLVWGSAILHHLNLEQAGAELYRVMRPGGVAVFCEPWGENPLLNVARKWFPYPGKGRTADEHPLRLRDLQPLRQRFASMEVQGFQLLGMIRRAICREPRGMRWLDRIDTTIMRRLPIMKKFARYVVITLRR